MILGSGAIPMSTEITRKPLDRRQVLKRLALLLGGSITTPVWTAALTGCRREPGTAWQARTLTASQDRLVTALAELIIPETDTPGAAAARVNEFVDLLLTDWYDPEDRNRFLAGLTALEEAARSEHGQPFLELSEEQQIELLEPLDRESVAIQWAAFTSRDEAEDLPFFGMMKEMTLVGYYTSEIGLGQELGYVVVPSRFDGCVPLDDVGRTST